MKISGKVTLIIIYVVVTFIATASLQTNPLFQQALDTAIKSIQDLGAPGMLFYILVSAVLMTLAIPLQFIDMVVGIIYPLKYAVLVLIGSKLLGAALSFYAANHVLSEDSRRGYTQSTYLKGLQELVRREPLKYGLLIRFSSIPIIIRNYGLAVLPINFAQYMACVFVQSSVSSPFQALAGSQFTSFMEFATSSGSTKVPEPVQLYDFAEGGENAMELKPKIDASPTIGGERLVSMGIVILGMLCSVFTAYKIKRKVEEINKAAEEKTE